jgi:hypothetical protein
MSYYDYSKSRELLLDDPPYAALIMAAMRKADTTNVAILQEAYPQIWHELQERYNALGGLLTGERL